MFKIENYITPIILNHVAKYVKNLRPQDAQVSLWEGEAVFQNLDLRLDVLEEELNLPFEFLSGHIHELSIHVPWTKITSEPIRININTIEFVLKLKDVRPGGTTSSSTSSSPQRGRTNLPIQAKRQPRAEEHQQSQFNSGLINKIVHNIALQCHNIILKYVEEDIVVSMNVQLLSFDSADEQWRPAMVDVHPVRSVIRKLCQISDFTICLDKSNAAGQIDVCQEPLLYRCSLECRILHKSSHSTRIAIRTKAMDMNVSALQFPMAMRLFNLIMALKSGKLEESMRSAIDISDDGAEENENTAQSNESYLVWAWNLLPRFNFQLIQEEEEQEVQIEADNHGHVMDFGVYIEHFQFTLKNSEFVNDSIMGTTKRFRYTPIVRVILNGIYVESVISPKTHWSCIRAGVSSIQVEPLGTYRTEEKSVYIVDTIPMKNMEFFIDKSLFDEKFTMSERCRGTSGYTEYIAHVTDDYLLFRTSAIAFDKINFKQSILDDLQISSREVSSDMRVQFRILSSGITIRYCDALLLVMHKINELIQTYDYPAYCSDCTDMNSGVVQSLPKLHPPLMEDYDALMQYIPLCTYKFNMHDICFEIHAKTHPDMSITSKPHHRRVSLVDQSMLPHYLLHVSQLEGSMTMPLDSDRLIHTTCQLPEKPTELLAACYNNFQFTLKETSILLVEGQITPYTVRLFHTPKVQVNVGILLHPDLWKDEGIAIRKLDVCCEKFIIEFSKKDLIRCERLLSCILSYSPPIVYKLVKCLPKSNTKEIPVRLQNEFIKFRVQKRDYKHHSGWNASLRGLQSSVVGVRQSGDEVRHLVFLSTAKIHQNQQIWLECQAQFSKNSTSETENVLPTVFFGLWVECYHIAMDSRLVEFLEYEEEPEEIGKETNVEVEIQTHIYQPPTPVQPHTVLPNQFINSSIRRSSRPIAPPRKISHPEETIHVSSERDDKFDVELIPTQAKSDTNKEQNTWIRYAEKLMFNIKISQGKLNIAPEIHRGPHGLISNEYMEIVLPKISFESARAEFISRSDIRKKITVPTISTFNWNLALRDFEIRNSSLLQSETLLDSLNTTITIAMTHKQEKLQHTVKQFTARWADGNRTKRFASKKVESANTPSVPAAAPVTQKNERSMQEDTASLSADGRTNSDTEDRYDDYETMIEDNGTNEPKKSQFSREMKQVSIQHVVSLTLHADTTPVNLHISDQKTKIVHDNIKLLLTVLRLFKPVALPNASSNNLMSENIKILMANEDNVKIKEFLEMETNSEASKSTEQTEHKNLSKETSMVATYFCQWTVAKIIIELELESSPLIARRKISLDFEDLLASVVIGEDYTKCTGKIGSYALNYHQPNSVKAAEWEKNDCLRMRMFGEAVNMPFFNFIFTTVGLKMYYNRIGAKKTGGDLTRSISEVVVTIQAIEIIMDLDKIIDFVNPLSTLFNLRQQHNSDIPKCEDNERRRILPASELPMIHLTWKGLVLYIPINTCKPCNTVLMCKIEGILVTPELQNPLQRNPLRPDVYSKATQIGILNSPGGIVEDRQYELVLQNISAATGDWKQIQRHMQEQDHHSLHANPAFQWNHHHNRQPSLQLTDLFNNFKFIVIYAPDIVYNDILICGQAIEFNCASDFLCEVNTLQLMLLNCLFSQLLKISETIQNISSTNCAAVPTLPTLKKLSWSNSSYGSNKPSNQSIQQHPLQNASHFTALSQQATMSSIYDSRNTISKFVSIDEDIEQNIPSDSGVYSSLLSSANNYKDHRACTVVERDDAKHATNVRHPPQTISFIAGIFVLNVFELKENSATDVIQPLLSITISQPSFIITRNIYDSIGQFSLFDLHVSMPASNTESINSKQSTHVNLFPELLLETRSGEMSATRIPPSLISIKRRRTKMQLLEVDIDVSRPILIKFSEAYVSHLYKGFINIYDVLLENPYFALRSLHSISRGTKIRQLREQTFYLDRLHLKCQHITVKFFEQKKYNCKLFCMETKLHLKFLKRPEKASIKGSIGAFYMQTGGKMFIHPISLRCCIDLITEPWHCLPLVIGSVKFNVIRLDVGISALLQLRDLMEGLNRVTRLMNEEWRRCLGKHPMISPELIVPTELIAFKSPSLNSENYTQSKKKKKTGCSELYQDDLRAGAFQFVELLSDSVLPLPYQIQIIKINYGIICWRYPHPRKMNRIHIYPIPMLTTSMKIKCRIQYFSEVHEGFLNYCDFWLSDIISQDIDLPERDICSTIWRVIILQPLISVNGECFDTSEEDEDFRSIVSVTSDDELNRPQKENEFVLNPKALVGCMRIDTIFDSQSVPKVQLLVSCNHIEVKLLNEPNENVELPTTLKKFRLAPVSSISQTFAVIEFSCVRVHPIWLSAQNFSVDTNLSCQITCLDYSYLNMLRLLEPVTLQTYVRVNKPIRLLVVSLVLDKLHLNLGPSIMHTISVSKMHWDELLDRNSLNKRHALISKCIVANHTMSKMSFGQTGTIERIHLQPMECHIYSFRSDFHNQELTFFVADEISNMTEVSQSVKIPLKFKGDTMLQSIRVGNKCIIVQSKKLSGSQIYVLIKGQIELLSMVPHELRIDLCRESKPNVENQRQEFHIAANSLNSFYRSVGQNTTINMRLKFANSKGKGRSGDIPLRSNKNLPWLVKVPTQKPNDFVSFWVRIIREDITQMATDNFHPQKILITIWPIFIIGSRLSCPIMVVDKETDTQIIIQPQGDHMALSAAATHLTEHALDFNYGFDIGPTTPKSYTLTLKTMPLNTFFSYDEQMWTCDYALQELSKDIPLNWPIVDKEEHRVKRITYTPAHADVILQCKPLQEFASSLYLELSPWAMFINGSGISISVYDSEAKKRTKIDPNGVQMLSIIDKSFTIDIENEETCWDSSLPIYCNSSKIFARSGRYYLLQENSFVDITIRNANNVIKFVLGLKVENQCNVFKLSSKFVFTNFTDHRLCLLPFAMDHKESASRADVLNLDVDFTQKVDVEPVKDMDSCIGFALDSFNDLNIREIQRSNDTAFVYFVCLKSYPNSNISIPIPLGMPFTRRCFSIQKDITSIPFSASLLERGGIYYLNIFHDISPGVLVNNRTDMEFVIAQTTASEHSKVTNTTPEYEGKHFEWFQLLRPFSDCYYTPPEMYASFPDVESTVCNLTLALYKDNMTKKDFKWSKPIRTDKSWSKFLHIPEHGDVKVIICDKHHVIRVSIFYMSEELEFSVKDLRCRIPTQLSNSDVNWKENTKVASRGPCQCDSEDMETAICSHYRTKNEEKMQWRLRFYAKEIMLNLYTDSTEKDCNKIVVFSIFVDDMLVMYDDDNGDTSGDGRALNVLIPNLQLDNQMHSTGKYDFPVILCAQELYTRTTHMPRVYYLEQTYQQMDQEQLMIVLNLKFFNDEMKIDSVKCTMSPLRAYVEDAYLNDLLDTLLECDPSQCVYRPKDEERPIKLITGEVLLARELVAEAVCYAEPLQLRSFQIGELSVLLSVHTSVRLYIALDHSPLSFSSYERTKLLTIPLRFGQSVGMHFLSGAIFGAGWVVGSLEILGSPTGLARSFSTGLKDFVSMPVQGLFRGPWGFIVGITQGSASLLRNVTAGTVNSLTKLAASVARNLDRLTLDPEHIERTETLRRTRPRGFAEGFSQGITGLGISLLGAVGGLAHHTLEARSPFQVVTGVGRGLVGAVTKPLSGAAELLALTGQGVLHTVGFNTMPMQRNKAASYNLAMAPAAYRIWKLLPIELITDQILFYHEVTLNVNDSSQSGYVFLTNAVFALLEAQWDRLILLLPVKKVQVSCDRDDKTLFYVHNIRETDDAQEDMSYTNQRIMSFLRSSFSVVGLSAITIDSLEDLLQAGQEQVRQGRNWSFHINPDLGNHLMQYLSIIKKSHH